VSAENSSDQFRARLSAMKGIDVYLKPFLDRHFSYIARWLSEKYW